MVKKYFFRDNSKAEIKRKDLIELDELIGIVDLNKEQYVVVPELIPKNYATARKFMKHGLEVKPKRYHSIEQAVKEGKTPVQLREIAFNSLQGYYFCGYTFMPLGLDRRKRKVSLIECLEGARIFAYAHQTKEVREGIKIKTYADAKKVRLEGADVVAEVPSRTQGERRIQLKLMNIPIVDSPEKYAVACNFASDHSCSSKRFNIRYKYQDDKESSGIVNICAHEISTYLELIQKEWNENKNIIPLQMCQFAIPSQFAVDFYLKLENNILIKDENIKTKDKLRKLNRAEKEILLWRLVKEYGHDKTFYSIKSRDGNVADYKWHS